MTLELTPITLREANAFVEKYHRHNGPVRGCICCVAASENGEVVGVAIVGRPLARKLQDTYTAEVLRLCTNGAAHACSKLYAASWRAARALGYRKLITYTLKTEPGTSLRAFGMQVVAEVRAESWSRKERPRVDTAPHQEKLRWEIAA